MIEVKIIAKCKWSVGRGTQKKCDLNFLANLTRAPSATLNRKKGIKINCVTEEEKKLQLSYRKRLFLSAQKKK